MSLHSLLHLLLVVFITWCGIAVYLYFSQSRLLYYPDMPSRALEASPADVGLAYDTVRLTAGDGTRLHAWFVPAATARGTLLFNHGNAGNIAHRLDSISLFHSLGLNVLIFDYRGYGESEGKPSEKGTYLDVQAAWQHPSAGVILESAFTSVPDMAASLYPWLPVRLLSRYRYNNLDKVERITSPLLVVHSREDDIIPYVHGEQLFAKANEPKQFLEMRGRHNDGYHVSRKIYVKRMQQFLDEILPLSSR
jgi:fermentation-respiration switch protein FrsA (DUF1100 family)